MELQKARLLYADCNQMWTIWITLYDLHQLHVERVGVTSCHLHMWTSCLVSVAAHLTSQIIYHLMNTKILNISLAQHLQPIEHYLQFSMFLC